MLESGFYNMDCMEAMKDFPDGFFELAIVDPPYGDGGQNIGGGRRFGGLFDRYKMEPVRPEIRPVQVPHPDADGQPLENIRGGGATSRVRRGGYHGKWPDAVEPGAPGRQNSAKKS